MDELKPIEAGCMAVTINCSNPSNNGKFCTIIKDHGFCSTNRGIKHTWEIDVYVIGKSGNPTNYIEGKKLLRIDDPDLKEEEEIKDNIVEFEGYSIKGDGGD